MSLHRTGGSRFGAGLNFNVTGGCLQSVSSFVRRKCVIALAERAQSGMVVVLLHWYCPVASLAFYDHMARFLSQIRDGFIAWQACYVFQSFD